MARLAKRQWTKRRAERYARRQEKLRQSVKPRKNGFR